MTDELGLAGKVVVITGAARGLGFTFARALAEAGALPVLTDRDEAAGAQAVDTLLAGGLPALFMPLDVTDAAAAEAVAERAVAEAGRLDVWINNAGLALHGPSETMPVSQWQTCIDVMLSGTFYGAQAAGRHMLAQGSGHIINIASVNGFVAQAGRAAYCAAKAGVIRLTEVLAAEWGPRGVRVNAVAPAVFMTDLARAAIADGSASLDVYLRRSPSGRLGELPELVHAILFLASDRSAYITGQTLRVDGAWVSDHAL